MRRRTASTWPTPTRRRDVVGQAIADLGGIDILVNNAGILKMAPLLEIDPADWDLTFDVNVRAMLLTIQVAAKAMIPNGRRHDHQHGQHGRQDRRAEPGPLRRVEGRRHLAHPGRRDGARARTGSRSTASAPATCSRRWARRRGPTRWSREWSSKSPLGRLAEPSDVANMAVFLASDEASYCTGQAMNVTGGMVMH